MDGLCKLTKILIHNRKVKDIRMVNYRTPVITVVLDSFSHRITNVRKFDKIPQGLKRTAKLQLFVKLLLLS